MEQSLASDHPPLGPFSLDGEGKAAAHVALFGDSILQESTEEIAYWLTTSDEEYLLTFSGWPGNGFDCCADYWKERTDELFSQMTPDYLVVQLGTNDWQMELEDFRKEVENFIENVPEETHILWVEIRTQMVLPGPVELNHVLYETADKYENMDIVHMDQYYWNRTDLIDQDTVHLTQEGEETYARMIHDYLLRAESMKNDQWTPNGWTTNVIPPTTTTTVPLPAFLTPES